MTDFTIDDMIASAIEGKPAEFKTAFDSIMASRVAQAVENKKIEVAQSMFNNEHEVEEPEHSEQQELEV